MKKTLLIITADDFGLDPRRDDGILEAFTKGAISQASLLVKGANAREAVSAAMRARLPLGLHLDLTETPACAQRARISTLLDADGRKLGKHGLREALALGRVDLTHVERETRAQLAHFRFLTRARATHVDGHQHIHVEPALAPTLAAVFASEGVRTTRISEQRALRTGSHGTPDPAARRFYRAVSAASRRARATYLRHGIRSSSEFLGLDTMGFEMSDRVLRARVKRLRGKGSIELMCHPGYAGTGWDEFNQSPARESELRVLGGRPFDGFFGEGWLKLTSFEGINRGK